MVELDYARSNCFPAGSRRNLGSAVNPVIHAGDYLLAVLASTVMCLDAECLTSPDACLPNDLTKCKDIRIQG